MSENTTAVTAWMVTSGSYSDYAVSAVFTDKVLAEAFRERFNRRSSVSDYDGAARVEEVALNPEHPPVQHWWIAWVNLQGETVSQGECDEPAGYRAVKSRWEEWVGYEDRRAMGASTRSAGHALAIARDKLAEWKAKQAGL